MSVKHDPHESQVSHVSDVHPKMLEERKLGWQRFTGLVTKSSVAVVIILISLLVLFYQAPVQH